MHNQSEVAAHANRPEIVVLCLFEFVELQTRMGRVHLQVKRCGFDSLLLLTRQSGKAVCKGIRDAEFHFQAQFGVVLDQHPQPWIAVRDWVFFPRALSLSKPDISRPKDIIGVCVVSYPSYLKNSWPRQFRSGKFDGVIVVMLDDLSPRFYHGNGRLIDESQLAISHAL